MRVPSAQRGHQSMEEIIALLERTPQWAEKLL
jgi:hypothetical protein